MSRGPLCIVALAALAGAAQAQEELLHNGGFEILDDFTGEPEGWQLFNTARFVETGDPGALIRSGERALELPSGADFVGATTNLLDDNFEFYDPPYVWRGGPARVSGWYAIPADQPLDGASSGLKLEFRRDDTSIYLPVEDLSIDGHTDGQWVQMSIIVGCDELSDEWPPFATSVSVLPIRFGASDSTGTIFWDDLSFTQCLADTNCDSAIDTRDVIAFLNLWTASDDQADFDGNGAIDTRDVIAFLNAWTQPCP
ncbi:MAG TPA: GC-type dockerin domain-anchored protein [Phycisphaerales bacterium]|nr:GC-type dockerin domain-anchored protein [Phycisphaerales bacterium]